MRISGRAFVVLLAMVGLGIVAATDQILPATSEYQAQMRVWLAARATGIVALLVITAQVVLGIVLSHPEQAKWKQGKKIFPWHESLWVFALAFLAVHVVSLVIDPYAGVGIGGALIPGMSEYRSAPVAVGVISLYALLITGLTARYTKFLPPGLWLKLHRLSLGVLVLAWIHGVLAGTDSDALRPLYWGTALSVVAAGAYRYWVVRQRAAHHRQPASPAVAATTREEPHVEPHVEPVPAP
jgi:sulfoxide reductase heme-binding subunit YedZ